MGKKEIDLVMVSQAVSMLLIVHSIYLLLGLEMVFIYQKIFLLASGLPILISSILLLFFALHLLLRKKMILWLLIASVALSWIGCAGWFLCHKVFDRFNDWEVFFSPVFWFPVFIVIYFTRQKIKKQFSGARSGAPNTA
jgi:hypothetical protein